MDRALLHTDNGYRLGKAVSLRGHLCKTNQASNTAFRGFGGPQGTAKPPTPVAALQSLPDALRCGTPWHRESHLPMGKPAVLLHCSGLGPTLLWISDALQVSAR